MSAADRIGRGRGSSAGQAKAYLDKTLSWEQRLELARATRAEALKKSGEHAPLPALKPWENAELAIDGVELCARDGAPVKQETQARPTPDLAEVVALAERRDPSEDDAADQSKADPSTTVAEPIAVEEDATDARPFPFAELNAAEDEPKREPSKFSVRAEKRLNASLVASRFRSAPVAPDPTHWRTKIAAAMLICLVTGGSIGFWVASVVLQPSAASEVPADPTIKEPASTLPGLLQRFRMRRTADGALPENTQGDVAQF